MPKYLIFLFFLVSELAAAEQLSHLGTQLKKAQAGDYIITHQSGTHTLLIVQASEGSRLLLQEISVPDQLLDPKAMNSEWLRNSAPGHTSWILFEIDMQDGSLQENYDLDKKGWLYLQPEEHLLVKLFHLSMKRLADGERRHIGPPPSPGEPDFRAVWQPPQVLDKSVGKNKTEAWQAQWPPDESPLSGCRLDLYYDLLQPDFPFPISIDIQSSHYKAHVQVVKAGRQMEVPSKPLPRRPPQFLSSLELAETESRIRLRCPHYYNNIQLLALAAGPNMQPPIALPFQKSLGEAPEELLLTMKNQQLDSFLKKGERYRLIFRNLSFPECYVETEATFVWK